MTMKDTGAASAVAQRVAAALQERDRVGQALGIELLDIGPGRARMAMTVRDDMINGHDICHGAYLFALADTASAFAGNSKNANSLSQGATVSFLAPAKRGDRLMAEASETAAGGRTSYVDVRIQNQHGDTLALLRGQLRTVPGQVVEDHRPQTAS